MPADMIKEIAETPLVCQGSSLYLKYLKKRA